MIEGIPKKERTFERILDGKPHKMKIRTRAYQVEFGFDLLGDIGNLCGGPVGAAISKFLGNEEGPESEFSLAAFERGLESALKKLVVYGSTELIGNIFSNTDLEIAPNQWVKLDMNTHFVRNYLGAIEVATWVMLWQYADFFAGLYGGLQAGDGVTGLLEMVTNATGINLQPPQG